MKHDFNTILVTRAIRNIPKNVLTPIEKLILYTLATCANADNLSWHGQQSLADMCSLSLRSLRDWTKSLRRKKFLIIYVPETYCRAATKQYELNLSELMKYAQSMKAAGDAAIQPKNEDKAAPSAGQGGRRCRSKAAPSAGKVIKEVIKEEGDDSPFLEGEHPSQEKAAAMMKSDDIVMDKKYSIH